MRIVRQFFLALTLLATPAAANGQVERVAAIGGLLEDLILLDDHVISSVKHGLYVIDVSSPTDPAITQYIPLPGACGDLDLDGDRLVVAAGDAGVHVLDVSDVTNPQLLTTVDGLVSASMIDLVGQNIAVLDRLNAITVAFHMINLNGPAPALTDPVVLDDVTLSDIVMAGNYVFIAGQSGIFVMNVSDPTEPFFDRAHGSPSSAIAYRDGVLYGSSGTRINSYLLIGPELALMSTVDQTVNADAMYIDGDVLYATEFLASAGSIDVVDISDPTDLQLETTLVNTGASPRRIAASGDLIYYTTSYEGMEIADKTLPAELDEYQPYDAVVTPGTATGLHRVGETLFVADGEAGLSILDIADADHMTIVGSADTPGDAVCVNVVDDVAFVGETDALRMIDVSDPANPTLIGAVPDITACLDMDRRERTLYIAGGPSDGLVLLDVTDPRSPTIKHRIDTPGDTLRLSVIGPRIVVAEGAAGFSAYTQLNVDDEPQFVETVPTSDEALDIDARGRYLVVADGEAGVRVYRINPDGSFQYREREFANKTHRVQMIGDRIYAAQNVNEETGYFNAYAFSSGGSAFPLKFATSDTVIRDVLAGVGVLFMANGEGVTATSGADDDFPRQTIGAVRMPSDVRAIDFSDDGTLIAMGTRAAGVVVADISDIAAHVLRGSTPTYDPVEDVMIYGDTIYAADSVGETHIIDATNPGHLVRMEPLESAVNSDGMDNRSDLLALSDGLYDPSDPHHPANVWRSSIFDARFRGNELFKSTLNELTAYDITDPTAPIAFGPPVSLGDPYRIDVSNDLLITRHETNLPPRLFDVSDLGDIRQIHEFGDFFIEDAVIEGRIACIALQSDGVRVYDLTTPDAPIELVTIPVDEQARALVLRDALLYVGVNLGGVLIFDLTDILPCPGDANSDDLVNFDDLNALLDTWGASVPAHTGADADGSGAIDFNDLNILLDNWSATPCH